MRIVAWIHYSFTLDGPPVMEALPLTEYKGPQFIGGGPWRVISSSVTPNVDKATVYDSEANLYYFFTVRKESKG